MTLEEFAGRIERAKPKSAKGGPAYVGRCPSCASQGHDKEGTHFRVFEGPDEWLHVACVKGCDESQILASMGLSLDDRRVKAYETQKGVDDLPIHVYENADGYVAEKQRCTALDGHKFFVWKVRFRRGVPLAKIEKTSRNGKVYHDWPSPDEAGLNGEVDVLYRFPQLLKAIAVGKTIYIGEGESASDAAWSKGIMHTCQRAGAGRGKWLPVYTAQLKGAKEIVIVADRDREGEEYASEVFVLLRAAGFHVRVVRSKTTGEHDDLRDHLEAGFGPEDLIPAPDLMPERGLSVVTFGDDFEMVEMVYLAERHLPLGKCVLIDADGGTGKTSLMAAWAAAMSNGRHPIRCKEKLNCGPVKTLYLHHGEDDDTEIETVYRANGGKSGMISYIKDKSLKFDSPTIELIGNTIVDGGYKFVVADPLLDFLIGVVKDIRDALPAMDVLQKLQNMAASCSCTLADIRHTVKMQVGVEATNLGMGSNAFRNKHRGQFILRWHPDEAGVVIGIDGKGTLLNEKEDPFAFRRVGKYGEVQYLAEFVNPFEPKGGDSLGAKSKAEFCENWLKENLTGQYVKSLFVFDTLRAQGVSNRTVNDAMKRLGVKSVKDGLGEWLKHLDPPVDPFAD